MRPIVLATDGSHAAQRATREAIELARAFATSVVIVAVSHLDPPLRPYFGYQEEAARRQRLEDGRMARVLAQTAAAVQSAGVECEVVMAFGLVVEEICAIARRREARLVVVGTASQNRFRRAAHRSVAAGVLHAAPCPVLVVHETDNNSASEGRRDEIHPARNRRLTLSGRSDP